MVEQLVAPKKAVYDRITAMLRDYESGQFRTRQGTAVNSDVRPRVVVLLDDVESLGSGRALILERSTKTEVYMLTHYGTLTSNQIDIPIIKIKVNAVEVGVLPPNATRQQMLDTILVSDEVKSDEITVSLGNDDDFTAMRWFIEFDYDPLSKLITLEADGGSSLARTVIEQTPFMATSGEIEVNAVIPFGHPTPLRAGMIATVQWYAGIGYGITGVEPRRFACGNDSGNYVEEVY